eukprot:CAMPEP_0184654946 /NCGR_PEP_ID=MMETSP0308-20130426/12599_1 /TAXON_ID=38269 /ORGANISM="Gloeochaete witrockiana, Strain SAG 46.84" /LENGTH=552 /DNA_ID=CAMNT_0027091165 /DNA_START=94 /DNA_END=1752 /DNA_ORIENTATION=+
MYEVSDSHKRRAESNRTAQKRSRNKKKAEWETLCEEMERLKLENEAMKLERLVNRKYFFTAVFKAVEHAMMHLTRPSAVELDPQLTYKVIDYVETTMEQRFIRMVRTASDVDQTILENAVNCIAFTQFMRSYYAYASPVVSMHLDPHYGEIAVAMLPILEEFHGELGQHKVVLDHLDRCSESFLSEILALEGHCRRIVDITTELGLLGATLDGMQHLMRGPFRDENDTDRHRRNLVYEKTLFSCLDTRFIKRMFGDGLAERIIKAQYKQYAEACADDSKKAVDVPEVLQKLVVLRKSTVPGAVSSSKVDAFAKCVFELTPQKEFRSQLAKPLLPRPASIPYMDTSQPNLLPSVPQSLFHPSSFALPAHQPICALPTSHYPHPVNTTFSVSSPTHSAAPLSADILYSSSSDLVPALNANHKLDAPNAMPLLDWTPYLLTSAGPLGPYASAHFHSPQIFPTPFSPPSVSIHNPTAVLNTMLSSRVSDGVHSTRASQSIFTSSLPHLPHLTSNRLLPYQSDGLPQEEVPGPEASSISGASEFELDFEILDQILQL